MEVRDQLHALIGLLPETGSGAQWLRSWFGSRTCVKAFEKGQTSCQESNYGFFILHVIT